MNQYKQPQKEIKGPASKEKKVQLSRCFLRIINVAGLFKNESIAKAMPFIFFLTFLAMIYISTAYYAERIIRETNKITNELKELRSEYISTKSDLMFISKQSEVAKSVAPMQIKESLIPPQKIVIKKRAE